MHPTFETQRVNGALYCIPRPDPTKLERRGRFNGRLILGVLALMILPLVPAMIWVGQVTPTGDLAVSRIASLVAVLSMFLGPTVLAAWLVFKHRKQPRPTGPFVSPPPFDPPYPESISATIATTSSAGGSYYGLGWVSVHDGRLRGSTLEQAFDVARQDIDWVRTQEGRILVRLKERPELSLAHIDIRLNLRDFRENRRLRRELSIQVKEMPSSPRESTFPAQASQIFLYSKSTMIKATLWGVLFGLALWSGVNLALLVVPDAKTDSVAGGFMVTLSFAAALPIILWASNLEAKLKLKKRIELGFQEE